MVHMKSRELLTSSLRLTRHQLATNEYSSLHPHKMRGAEDALVWLLDERIAAAPLTGTVADSRDLQVVRREIEVAANVFSFGTMGVTLSATAESLNTWNYAFGVQESLAWAVGEMRCTAMGLDDDEVREFVAELDEEAQV